MTLGGKLGIYIDYLLGGQIWKPIHEKSQRTLDTLVQLSALGIANTPPTSAHGDTYIVGSAPLGAFAGQMPGAVATYHSTLSGWEFYTPLKGWQGWIDNDMYYYSGSQWLLVGALPSVTSSGSAAGSVAANTAITNHIAAADPHIIYSKKINFQNLLLGSGYQKLEGGLIIQWTAGIPFAASGAVAQAVPLTIAFPNALLQYFVTGYNNGSATEHPVVRRDGFSTNSQVGVFCANAVAGNTGFIIFAIGY